MRILHVLAQLPSKTGSGVYFNNVIKGLKDKYEQACVFGFQGEFYYDTISNEFQYAVEFKTEQMPFNIVGMSDVMPYDHTRYCDLNEEMQDIWNNTFLKTLRMAIDEFKPDIIICHHLWMLTSLVIDIAEDKTLIGICHGTDIRQCEKNPHLKQKYVDNIHKLDLVFALSKDQVEEIVDTYGIEIDKIKVIGGGYDENIFYPPKDFSVSDEVKIVYAGKLAKAKGVYEMLSAIKQIDGYNIKLIIIGARDEEHRLEFLEELKGLDNFELHAIISQMELADIFRESDIFILPSYFEGLGLVAIEALASGLRVVSSRIDGLIATLGDEVIDTGVIEIVNLPRLYHVDRPVEQDVPRYVEDLKNAIIKQIDNTLEERAIPTKVQDLISAHSWNHIVKYIENEFVNIRRAGHLNRK